MDERNEIYSSDDIIDSYKSYEGYLDDYNPDDYESDFWEDIIPDVDNLAEDFERRMEEKKYYYYNGNDDYDDDLTVEELDRRLDEEFFG